MAGVLESFVPMPVFITPFQTGIFAGVAAIGFLLPILAVLWPVFRAVRVQPVDAIRTGHLAARGGGLAPAISRMPLPGSSLGRMPFRNLMRAPRRTLLTLLALTAVLAAPRQRGRHDGLFARDPGAGRRGAAPRRARPARRTARLFLPGRFARGGWHHRRRSARRSRARDRPGR